MKKVKKYILEEGRNEFILPTDFKVLKVDSQGNKSCCIWILEEVEKEGEPEVPQGEYTFRVVQSNVYVPKNVQYCGTSVVMEANDVAFHVFLELPKKERRKK